MTLALKLLVRVELHPNRGMTMMVMTYSIFDAVNLVVVDCAPGERILTAA